MLVLTRRLNQSIKIGDDIEIMVIEVRGDQVRLGVTAPRQIAVHRKEIYQQIQQEHGKVHSSAMERPDDDAKSSDPLVEATDDNSALAGRE